MKVMLQRDWYAPGDLPQMYLRRNNPQVFDDETFNASILPHLPSGAQIEGSNGKYLTKRETRKMVLQARETLGLNQARPKSRQSDVFTDEELLAEIHGQASVAKAAVPADTEDDNDEDDKGLPPRPGAAPSPTVQPATTPAQPASAAKS